MYSPSPGLEAELM